MIRTTETFSFRNGDVLSLDQIYTVQGLAGGDWWNHYNNDVFSEMVKIIRTVKITVIVES